MRTLERLGVAVLLTTIPGILPAQQNSRVSTQSEPKPLQLITREVSLGKIDPGIIQESLVVSPDSRHVAYIAKSDNQ